MKVSIFCIKKSEIVGGDKVTCNIEFHGKIIGALIPRLHGPLHSSDMSII